MKLKVENYIDWGGYHKCTIVDGPGAGTRINVSFGRDFDEISYASEIVGKVVECDGLKAYLFVAENVKVTQ